MRKTLALLLAFVLVFSIVTLPASATEATTSIKSIGIDNLDSSINYLTGASSTSASGFSLAFSSGNYSLPKVGVVDTTAETQTIYQYPLIASKGTETIINEGYAKGTGYQFIMGSALGETYSGTDADTTGNVVTGQPMKGAYLKKVADPEDAANYVLEYNFGQTGNNAPNTKYKGVIQRMTFGTSTAMLTKTDTTRNETNADGETTTYTTYKKNNSGVMAYEYKFYIPENSAKYMTENGFITIGEVYSYMMHSSGHGILGDRTVYNGTTGKLMHSIYDVSQKVVKSFEITPDEWHTMKQIIIVDDEVETSDALQTYHPTVMLYFDDELMFKGEAYGVLGRTGSSAAGYEYNGSGQLRIAVAPSAKSTYADQTKNFNIYIDDVNQYWINDTGLTVSGIEDSYASFDVENDSVEISYSNLADFDALKDAITVKLNGEVADGVTVNVTEKDEKTAILTFDGMTSNRATTYSVEISNFADVYGFTADGKTFTVTTKAQTITAEDQINRIVTHNFDAYDVSSAANWIGTDDDGAAVDNSPIGWDITSPRAATTDTIKVIADPTGSDHGNVLEYTTSSTATGSNLRMLFDETSDALAEDDILQPLTDTRTAGRKLVVKYDVFVPASGTANSSSAMPFVRSRRDASLKDVNSSSNIFMRASYANGSAIGSNGAKIGNSGIQYATSYDNRHVGTLTSKTMPQGSWQTVTYVFDTSFTPDTTKARGNNRYRVYLGNDATLPYVSSWTYYVPDADGVIYDSTTKTLKGTQMTETVGENDDKLYDLWSSEALKLGGGSKGWGGAFVGMFVLETTLRASSTSTPSTVYFDNFEVYAPELFTITNSNDNLDEFDASLHNITYEFTTMVDSSMAKYVSLEDKNGNVVENGVNVTFADDKRGMTVKLNPNAITRATDYTVRIDPQFHDIYMQGFDNKYENIWTSSYYDVALTTADVDFFKAAANPEVFEGFKAGTERTIEFTFTAPVATAPESAFVVTDADGDVMTGWTATLSANKKVATVSLKNLDATGSFPYTISTLSDVTDANGRTIASITEVKINKAGKYEIFTDDYTSGFNSSDYIINNNAVTDDVGTIKAAADPTDSTNTVLEMTAQAVTSTSAGFDFYVSRKPTKYGGSIDFTNPDSPLYGKKLVVEMDNYTKSGYTQFNYNGAFLAFSRTSTAANLKDSSAYNGNYVRYNANGKSFGTQNSTNGNTKLAKNVYANRLNSGANTSVTLGKWETFRMIFDQTDTTRHDTHRVLKIGDDGSITTTKKEYTFVKSVAEDGTVTTAKTDIVNEGLNEYPEYVYDFMSERITNSNYLLFPGEENFSYNSANEYGTFYGALFGWKAGTTASTRYIDNLKAYAIDPFKIVSVSSNTDNFIPEKNAKIEIGFNQTLYSDKTQLKSNVMLLTKDENGKDTDVTSAVSDITINGSNDGLTITLDPNALTDNKEYEIAFGPLFVDEYGQALAVYQSELLVDRSRIYGDYAIKFTVLPYEGFNSYVDTTTVSNFFAGSERNVVITLTDATILNQAELANAFVVTDADGETVTGWTASLSEDGKTITIKLSGLDDTKTFPYTLKSLDTLVNDEGETLPAAITVTISKIEGIYTIFDETFETMTADVEWKNNLDTNNWVTATNTGVGENTWKYINSTGNTTNSVMVVNTTVGDRTGKFLKYTSGADGTTPYLLRNSNGDTGINFTSSDSSYYGKKLVYQADVYYDDFATTNDNASAFMNFNGSASGKVEGTFARLNANGILVSSGVWGNADYLRRTTLNLKNGWHTVTAVVDQTGKNEKIDYDNVRYYLDGEPVIVPFYDAASTNAPTYYMSNEKQSATNPAPSFGTFFGLAFGGLSEGKSFYIDNLKAYAIDGVAFGVKNIEFNKATGVITAEFNSVLDDDFLSLVTIQDADEKTISGATKAIAADGKTLVVSGITEPDYELFTEYKLVINGLFRDIYFNEFNYYNDYAYAFVTARSGELAIANEPVATVTSTSLTTTVEICNRTNVGTEFVMAVAVYDGYQLLGVQSKQVSLDAMSSISEDFELTGDYSTATNVKIHFWDSISGMNAMSIPEPIALSE